MQIDYFTWYYIFAAELTAPYSLSANELPPSHSTFPATSFPTIAVAFQYILDGRVMKMVHFGLDTKLDIVQCDKSDFQYWVIAPYLPNNLILLGELTKIITVSETRYSDFRFVSYSNTLMLRVSGAPNETVMTSFYYNSTGTTQTISCFIGTTGINLLSIGDDPKLASCSAM
jgi:hypothetical protein